MLLRARVILSAVTSAALEVELERMLLVACMLDVDSAVARTPLPDVMAIAFADVVVSSAPRPPCWVCDVCPKPVVSVVFSVVATRVLLLGPPLVAADDAD